MHAVFIHYQDTFGNPGQLLLIMAYPEYGHFGVMPQPGDELFKDKRMMAVQGRTRFSYNFV